MFSPMKAVNFGTVVAKKQFVQGYGCTTVHLCIAEATGRPVNQGHDGDTVG